MSEVTTMGELLVDFVPFEKDCKLKNVNKFSKAAGGAPANVAAALAKVDISTNFIGKVGNDPFGDFLIEKMSEHGVNTSNIIKTSEAMTTLAFVSLTASGERDFAFYRKPGADMLIEKEEITLEVLNKTSIFHFGSISLTDSPSRETTYYLLDRALENNIFITFDPNIRLPLWNYNLINLKEQFFKALKQVDLVKMNLNEFNVLIDIKLENKLSGLTKELTNRKGLEMLSLREEQKKLLEGVKKLLSNGPKYLIITDGDQGACLFSEKETIYSPAYKIKAIDTTGAGDAFMAGVIAQILKNVSKKTLLKINWEEVLTKANIYGALASSKYGAIPSFPYKEEISQIC